MDRKLVRFCIGKGWDKAIPRKDLFMFWSWEAVKAGGAILFILASIIFISSVFQGGW